MSESSQVLDILKRAILTEKRGFSFYVHVAETTKHTAVKKFFLDMAEEEKLHVSQLEDQYRNVTQSGVYKDIKTLPPRDVNVEILIQQIKQEIGAASYEAAAISAAISFEQNAKKFYEQRARETQQPQEAKLFQWLAQWEDGHLTMLESLDKELQEKIWYDNHFWPM